MHLETVVPLGAITVGLDDTSESDDASGDIGASGSGDASGKGDASGRTSVSGKVVEILRIHCFWRSMS